MVFIVLINLIKEDNIYNYNVFFDVELIVRRKFWYKFKLKIN